MSAKCLFCKIIKGDVAADIVTETKSVFAFHDMYPQSKTHILIIPKIHIASTQDFNDTNIHYLSEMAMLANKIAADVGIAKNGYRWVINTGEDGGQTVYHIHLHLLGGRKLHWPPG